MIIKMLIITIVTVSISRVLGGGKNNNNKKKILLPKMQGMGNQVRFHRAELTDQLWSYLCVKKIKIKNSGQYISPVVMGI